MRYSIRHTVALLGFLLAPALAGASDLPVSRLADGIYHLEAARAAIQDAKKDFRASRDFDYDQLLRELEKLSVKLKKEAERKQ